MTLPAFTMRQLLHAGVHFGHKTQRWNPRMSRYIFGEKNGIHIIDLQQTVPLLRETLAAVRDTVAQGGRLLFVGTKRQASTAVANAASRCGQYYINHRWLGGMLTNWKTISQSINRLRELDETLNSDLTGLTKKEVLHLTRMRDNLERSLGGIKDMGGLPDMLFVIDTIQESTAIKEANRLGIPIAAILDSNSSDEGITYPIPGNDDSTRSIELYCDLAAAAALDGIQEEMIAQGVDLGEKEETDVEAEVEVEVEASSAPETKKEDQPDDVVVVEKNITIVKKEEESKAEDKKQG